MVVVNPQAKGTGRHSSALAGAAQHWQAQLSTGRRSPTLAGTA